jgi:hypothetical protein
VSGRVIEDPLSVEFLLPGRRSAYVRRLDDLANRQMAGDLAIGLAAATHPHGPIRTLSVAQKLVASARRFAVDMAGELPDGGLVQLTPSALVGYWLACGYHRERHIRVVLGAFHDQGGLLDPGVVRHLDGRLINRLAKGRPNQPYGEGEWRRLTEALNRQIATAWNRHQAMLEAAAKGSDPRIHGVTEANLAWLLCRVGPVGVRDLDLGHGLVVARPLHAEVMRGLFPDGRTAFAYTSLFAMRTGIVPDGVDSLRVESLRRTSAGSMVVAYRKGRTGGEALNLPRDAVGLIDRWMEHSALLRSHGGARSDEVWLHIAAPRTWSVRTGSLIYGQPRSHSRRRAWMLAAGVLGDDGQLLAVDGARVRATYQHRRDRSAWTGRTTIDPNHSARVEGDHYLTSHTPAQLDAIEDIIEQSQMQVRRTAEPAVLVSASDAADFASRFPDLVAHAGLDQAAVTRLLSGEQDVFVASCASPTNSPHAAAGVLCPARAWVCLLCPLAAFSTRHLGNLLRLKEYFATQSARMTAAQFMGVFGPYASRLDDDILPRFPAVAITAALSAADHDDTPGFVLDLEEATP